MSSAYSSDADIDGWLHTLGVTSLCEWDTLMFLYRHQSSLIGADSIARFLGYATAPVVAALDGLEGLGLVTRSRVSQIVRLYQFIAPSDLPRGDAWTRLLAIGSHRAGRLRLTTRMRDCEHRGPEPPGRGSAVRPVTMQPEHIHRGEHDT
jgi:hypothetical protein